MGTGGPDPSHGVNPPDNIDSQLADLVRASFETEILHGVTCGNAACGYTSDRSRSQVITGPPDILCIQLRRFINQTLPNGTVVLRKINQRVSFGARIDLSQYLEDQRLGSLTLQYRLVAVVHQIGSLTAGHYITVARGPNGFWREMDDATVTRAALSDATDPLKSRKRE